MLILSALTRFLSHVGSTTVWSQQFPVQDAFAVFNLGHCNALVQSRPADRNNSDAGQSGRTGLKVPIHGRYGIHSIAIHKAGV